MGLVWALFIEMGWLQSWQELSGCSSDSLSINCQVVFSAFSQLLWVVDVYRRTISQTSKLQFRGYFPGITELWLTDVTVWLQCLCPPLQKHFIFICSSGMGWMSPSGGAGLSYVPPQQESVVLAPHTDGRTEHLLARPMSGIYGVQLGNSCLTIYHANKCEHIWR